MKDPLFSWSNWRNDAHANCTKSLFHKISYRKAKNLTDPYVFLGLIGLPSAILPTAYLLALAESVLFLGGSLCCADPRRTISVSSSWAGRRRFRSRRRKYTIFSVLCLENTWWPPLGWYGLQDQKTVELPSEVNDWKSTELILYGHILYQMITTDD